MSKTPRNGLTTKHWIGYMCGDFGGCMTFALMGSIVTRYYTNVLQVNTYVLATLLLIWNVWDAVNDPMMGALMDKLFVKHPNAKGKFRPWLLRSAPLLAVTAIAFWTVPTFFHGTTMLVILFICKILYEGMYTMFNIPMGCLLSAMADTDSERASLSSARGFGAMLGNMIPMAIAPLILAKYGDSNPQGYGVVGAVCAGIGFIICLMHYYMTEERRLVEADPEDAANLKFSDILQVFKKNRAFLALCLHGVCICTMQYVSSTLGTYMFADVLGDIKIMSSMMVVSMPLSIVVLVTAPWLAKKLGLVPLIRYSLLIGAAMYVGLFALVMTGNINPWTYMILSAVAQGISGVSIQMQWGLVGEAVDYNEYLTGKRTEGSIYGTFNLTRRIGQTIGNSAGVLALGWIGYDTAIAQAGGVQAASTLTGIKVLCVLLPAVFIIGSWLAFKFVWNITPDVKEKMTAAKAAKEKKV